MKRSVTIFLVIFALAHSASSQTLDYARDVFFFEGQERHVRDFYYYYTPLSGHMQSYTGRGLNVVIAGKKRSIINMGLQNIKLDSKNYGYLRDLKIILKPVELIDYIENHKVDVLILEEDFVREVLDLAQVKSIYIIIYNEFASINRQPNYDKRIPKDWHYSFKLNNISKELRAIWHYKEEYRNFYLYASQSKDFLISNQNFIWLGLLCAIIAGISSYGYYLRWSHPEKRKLAIYILCLFSVVMSFCLISFVSKLNKLDHYYRHMQVSRIGNDKQNSQLMSQLNDVDKRVVLKALTKLVRLTKDKSHDLFFEKNSNILLADMLKLNLRGNASISKLTFELKRNLGDSHKKLKLFKVFSALIKQLENSNSYEVAGALRALTEISMDSKINDFIKFNEKNIFENLKRLILHKDPRVRMWTLTLIEKNLNFKWLRFMMSKDIKSDPSFLVRSRYVRNLKHIEKTETIEELRVMLKTERHPYVLGEIKAAFLYREILEP